MIGHPLQHPHHIVAQLPDTPHQNVFNIIARAAHGAVHPLPETYTFLASREAEDSGNPATLGAFGLTAGAAL
jgi:hypothetical protein